MHEGLTIEEVLDRFHNHAVQAVSAAHELLEGSVDSAYDAFADDISELLEEVIENLLYG